MKPRSNRNLDLLLFCTLDSEDWSFVFCLLMDHGEEDETIMDTSSVILAFRICITSGSCPDSVARKTFSSFSSCERGGEKREESVYLPLI